MPLKFEPPKGAPPVLQWIAPADLQVDHSYQRSASEGGSQRLIRKIAQAWDWALAQMLIVSRRPDGSLFVIDGQHRLMAARMRGDIPHLPCVIVDKGDLADEARLFTKVNKTRKAVSGLEVFRSELAAGDPDALAIEDILTSCGYTLARHTDYDSWKVGWIGCVASLRQIYKAYGRGILSACLCAMSEAYPGEVLRYNGTLILPLARAYHDLMADGAFDPDLMIEAIAARADDEWYYMAKGLPPRERQTIFVDAYSALAAKRAA